MCVTTQPNNAPQVLASARTDLSLSDITTLRIGGPISTYVETHSEDELVQVVEYADANSIDILVVGGGSNIVAADEGFDGIVVRDMRSGVNIDQVDSCGGGSVTVPAGHNWDDFVVQSIAEGWIGIESLIGIPGSVGAAPVQNIGAYGAEVANVISSVRVYDRGTQRKRTFALFELGFGYRDSIIKQSMTIGDDSGRVWGPTPRYVVLEVSFQFRLGTRSAPVQYAELAKRLGVNVGDRAPAKDIAQTVLELRGGKGMHVDASDRPELADTAGARGTLPPALLAATSDEIVSGAAAGFITLDAEAPAESCGTDIRNEDVPSVEYTDSASFKPDFDRWSAGSFFTNPIIAAEHADELPEGAPRYPVHSVAPLATTGPSTGAVDAAKVKTSAAWLIQNAGFDRGFGVHGESSAATLSTKHTLALTNRGSASAADVRELASAIRAGVQEKFGILLEPEPVVVGPKIN